MSLESRIRSQLATELRMASATTGSLDDVMSRGRRRRLAYRLTQGVAIAAALVLAVGTTALVVQIRSSAEFVASPTTGLELAVISQSPLVVRAEPGPLPEPAPVGTEVRLTPIDNISPEEAEGLGPNQWNADIPIVAIGELTDERERVFALDGLAMGDSPMPIRLVSYGPDAVTVWGSGDDPSVTTWIAPSRDGTGHVFLGRPPIGTVWVQIQLPEALLWQRPSDGVVILPFEDPPDGVATITAHDGSGAVLFEQEMIFTTAEAYVAPPPGTIDDWINNLGLLQQDEELWANRLTRACAEGVWDLAVAERLAAEYMALDRALSVGAAEAGEPTVRAAAESLWRMSAQYCGESFPEGVLETGPFGGSSATR